jgi:RNA polymerase sigma-70 factor, ECF subfamily
VHDAEVRESTNSDALERLYRDDGERLWRALLGYAGDVDVASDSMAEAFAQALRRREEIRSVQRWVWRAAFRIAAGELKRRRLGRPSFSEGSYQPPESIADLLAALRRLPAKQRGAIVLHHSRVTR